MLAVFPPKPPKPDELLAVAVLLLNMPPPELVLVPKAVVPPKGLDVEPVAPKPKPLEFDICHGLSISISFQAGLKGGCRTCNGLIERCLTRARVYRGLRGHLKQASSRVLYVPPNPVLVEVLLLAAPKTPPPVLPELAPNPVLLDCPKPKKVNQYGKSAQTKNQEIKTSHRLCEVPVEELTCARSIVRPESTKATRALLITALPEERHDAGYAEKMVPVFRPGKVGDWITQESLGRTIVRTSAQAAQVSNFHQRLKTSNNG